MTEKAIGKIVVPEKKTTNQKLVINLDNRIEKFEKLRGLVTQRDRLIETLNELTQFNYNQDGSSSFQI